MNNKVRVVAEIGCNHQGSLKTAKKMIDVLVDAGVNEIKGQKRDLNSYPHWKDKPYENPNSFGPTYYEHRKALELSWKKQCMLKEYAASKGANYFLSVWDVASLKQAWDFGFGTIKLPSAMIADEDLLLQSRQVCSAGGELIMATGMSTDKEIAHAFMTAKPHVVLACTSMYPCLPEFVNLATMDMLRHVCAGAEVGVSGHWAGTSIDLAAAAMGAVMIERHFTLNRAWKGTDHAASLEPDDIATLVSDLEDVRQAIGTQTLGVLACEESARAKLRARAEKLVF